MAARRLHVSFDFLQFKDDKELYLEYAVSAALCDSNSRCYRIFDVADLFATDEVLNWADLRRRRSWLVFNVDDVMLR